MLHDEQPHGLSMQLKTLNTRRKVQRLCDKEPDRSQNVSAERLCLYPGTRLGFGNLFLLAKTNATEEMHHGRCEAPSSRSSVLILSETCYPIDNHMP